VTQLALSYTADSTNGMGYIIKLSDGSFIVYDGGFTADSETIMDALTRLNVTGVKPHIRMWLLTHMHGDHAQAFLQFSADHAKDVLLDYLALNVADKYYDVDYSNYYTKGTIASALIKFSGAKLLKLHAGTVLHFADAEIEILSTQEELYPGLLSLDFGNDTSVVSRVTLGGQMILFPGDAQTFESDMLISMYGSYLKSDIVQISHHGSIKYPATIELYKMIAPAWAFFPGSLTRYAENSASEVNKYLIKESGIKQIFVADKSDRTITLPTG
jgi:competence protein ComEC